MLTTTLNWNPAIAVPFDVNAESKFYLLNFDGWQYEVVRWSDEHQRFYIGDTYQEGSNFQWAVLPMTL